MPTLMISRAKLKRLESLQLIARAVNSDLELDSILDTIVGAVVDHGGWDKCGIAVVDPFRNSTRLAAVRGLEHDASYRGGPLAPSMSQMALATGKPLTLKDARRSRRFPYLAKDAKERGYAGVLAVPLAIEPPEGALWIMHSEPHVFEPEEVEYAKTIADHAAIAIRNARLLAQARQLAAVRNQVMRIYEVIVAGFVASERSATIVETLSELASRPVVLIDNLEDPSLVLVSQSAKYPHGELGQLAAVLRRGDDRVAAVIQSHTDAGSSHEGVPLHLDHLDPALTGTAVVRSLHLGPRRIGYLLLPGDTSIAEQPSLSAVIEGAALALGLELVKRNAAYETELRLRASLLADLFRGDHREEAEIRQRAQFMGLDLDAATVLCAIRPPPAEGPPDQYGHLEQYVRQISRLLSVLWSRGIVASDSEDVIVLLPLGDRSVADTLVPIHQIHDRVHDPSGGRGVTVVVGPVCSHLADYSTALRECKQAFAVPGLVAPGGFTDINKLGLYRFLLSVSDQSGLEAFVRSAIGCLLDPVDGPKIETLRVFLRNSGNYQRTALEMGLHVSSLRYRLRRIEETCGWVLSDPDLRFNAQLALRIRELFPLDD